MKFKSTPYLPRSTSLGLLAQACFLITASLVLFSSAFQGGPILDDNKFIFSTQAMPSIPSALSFWYNDSGHTRSWPLSYSLLWLVHSVAGKNYIVYKFINIFLHGINSALLLTLLKKNKIKSAFLVAVIFLIHPIQVETVSWMFQFKTLLATTLLFLSMTVLCASYEKSNKLLYTLSLILFFLSLKAKIVGIFIPLLMGFMYKKLNSKKTSLLVLPFILISLACGIETVQGVNYNKTEVIEQSVLNQEIKASLSSHSDLVEQGNDLDITRVKNSIYDSPDMNTENKNSPQILENLKNKTILFFSTSSFYITKFLFYGDHSLFYQKNHLNTVENYFNISVYLSSLILLAYITYVNGAYNVITISSMGFILSIIPVSGIVYVPYMKFSLIADHWAYLAVAFLSIIIVCIVDRLQGMRRQALILAFIALSLIRTYEYSVIFNDEERIVDRAIEHNSKTPIIYLQKLKLLRKKKDFTTYDKFIKKVLENPVLSNDLNILNEALVYYTMTNRIDEVENIYMSICEIKYYNDQDYSSELEKVERLNSSNNRFLFLKTIIDLEDFKSTDNSALITKIKARLKN